MSPTTSRERSVAAQRRTDRAEATNRSQPTKTTKKRIRLPRLTRRQLSVSVAVAVVITGIAAGYLSRDRWLHPANQMLAAARERMHGGEGDQNAADVAHGEADAHADCSHDAPADATSLQLSEQGQKTGTIEHRDHGEHDHQQEGHAGHDHN